MKLRNNQIEHIKKLAENDYKLLKCMTRDKIIEELQPYGMTVRKYSDFSKDILYAILKMYIDDVIDRYKLDIK